MQPEIISLSLQEAVDLALKNNLGIESNRLKFDQKKWALATSWNEFIPSASSRNESDKE